MSFETRLNDPEYQNWLKCGQALILLVGSLRPLAEDTIKTFHGTLQNELGHLGVCQQNCKSKKKPDDGCAVCGPWKQKLMEKHSTKQVFWTNTDPKSWPGDRWEIAKLYMSRGQKPNQPITAADLDATHMLNLIKNCKEFHAHVPKKLPDKVLQKRNKIMHSSQMKLTDNDSQDIIDLFTQFLQDETKLHALPETQKAVQEIQQLDKTAFAVNIQQKHAGSQSAGASSPKVMSEKETKQLEHTLIQNMVEDFNKRLEVLESTEELSFDNGAESKVLRKSVEDLQNFVNDNTDLKEVFGRGLDDLKGKYDYLEEKYEYLEEKVEEINEGFQEMYIRLGAVEDKPLPGSPAANYVSLLQQVTDELEIAKPVYTCIPEELGQICSVTVAGHTYRTPRPHRTKQEAKQDAAHMAYLILKERIKSGQHKPAQLVDDPTNYIGQLQEYTQQRKLPKPEYCPKNKNTMDMLFTESVEVKLPDGRTLEFENPEPEKSLQRAKRGAAQQALKEIERQLGKPQLRGTASDKQQKSEHSVNVKPLVQDSCNPHKSKATSDVRSDLDVLSTEVYKTRLQVALQKLHGSTNPPKYEDVELASQPGTFRSKVTINAKHMIQSGLFASKKDAEKDAARRALAQLGLQPTDNPKGRALQLPTKVVFQTEKVPDTNQFQSILLSDALENISNIVLLSDSVGKTKKDAQEEAAKKTCEKLGILDEVKESAAEEPSKSLTYVAAEPQFHLEKQPLTHDVYNDPSADHKIRLQVALQKSHGATSPPMYEDVELASQPGTFRSKVTINAKHMIQSGLFTSKKEAERDVARLALKQLGQEPTDNPKGQVLQLHPKTVFETGKVHETNQFQSVLFLPALETSNTVVVYSDSVGKAKKERQDVQQSLAKNMCEKLGVQDEVKCSNVGELSETRATAVANSATGKPPPSPERQDPLADYKSRLQAALQKSHGATSPPKYEDVELASQPGTFSSKVTINAKHMIQSGLLTSKKDAERDVARLALKQLGQEPTDNPKGRVLQLHPQTAFETGKVPETNQFQSVLFLPALETSNTVVVYSDSVGKTKKERQDVQQSLAKNMGEKLGVQDEVKCSNVGEPSEMGATALPKSATGKPPPSPETQGESNIVPCGSMENEPLSATETYSCITKVETVDSHGAVLCLPISDQERAEVVLKIAKGALEQASIVSVSVDPCEQHPAVREDQLILGSVISCQPEGQTFMKPVTISLPHSGINVTEECLQVWCKSDSDGGMDTWRKIYDGQAKYAEKDVSVVVEGNRIKLRVTHFSMFDFVTVAVSAIASWIRPPEQMLTVIAYMDPVNVETCRNVCLRVYAIKKNDRASRKMIETVEKLHNSGMCCLPAGSVLKPNGSNLTVHVKDIKPKGKWLPAAASGEILYDNIQVGGIESRCEIEFEPKDAVAHAEWFEGSLDLEQEGNTNCDKDIHFYDRKAKESRNRDREKKWSTGPSSAWRIRKVGFGAAGEQEFFVCNIWFFT